MHRIFIVEDDAVIADVVERHLSGWGYQVRQCRDFEHVLEAFAAFDPQLVILDISLPFFNGYHWCARHPARSPRCPSSFSPPPRTI